MGSPKKFSLNKREQVLCMLAVVALTFGYTKWVFLKKRGEIAVMNSTAATVQASIQSLTSVIEAIQQKRKPASFSLGHSEPDPIPQYIKTSSHLSNLLKQLTEEDPTYLYNVKKIQARTVPPDASNADGKHYELIAFEILMETSFLSIGRFIEKLESSRFVLDVVAVEIKRLDSDLKRCNANIRLNSFVPKLKS